MDMNKKGQTMIVGLMVGVMIFMLAMVFINPIKSVIKEARNETQLDCNNASITDGEKSTCLIVDLILPYFIGLVCAVAGGWIFAKIII